MKFFQGLQAVLDAQCKHQKAPKVEMDRAENLSKCSSEGKLHSAVHCPISVQARWLSKSIGCPNPLAIQIHWLSKSIGCTNPLAIQIHWLYKSIGYPNPLAVQTRWLSKSVGCPNPFIFIYLFIHRLFQPLYRQLCS
jgi:hypothetical protein